MMIMVVMNKVTGLMVNAHHNVTTQDTNKLIINVYYNNDKIFS